MKAEQGPKTVPPIFIGRWTPEVLFSLKERPYRRGQLRRSRNRLAAHAYQNSSQSRSHRINRQARDERSNGIAAEYSLTRLGRTIVAPLRGMCRWAKRYHKTVSADVHLPEAYEVQ